MDVAPVAPLIEEAMKKAAIAWITVSGQNGSPPAERGHREAAAGTPATSGRPASARPSPVWCLWQDGAMYVVSGPGEQPVPGLASASGALVTLRGDHGGRVLTWPATVSTVDPNDARWSSVAGALAAKRLNSPGGAEQTVQRWASECVVSRLTPAGDPVEAGASLPDASLAEPAPQTPATRPTRRPFRLHRVRRTGRP
jgi:hypothetical protein